MGTDTKHISASMIAAAGCVGGLLPALLAAAHWYFPELLHRSDGADVILSPKTQLNPSRLPGTSFARFLLAITGADRAVISTAASSGKVSHGGGGGAEDFFTPARNMQARGWRLHCVRACSRVLCCTAFSPSPHGPLCAGARCIATVSLDASASVCLELARMLACVCVCVSLAVDSPWFSHLCRSPRKFLHPVGAPCVTFLKTTV
jgi:hypothetical protein